MPSITICVTAGMVICFRIVANRSSVTGTVISPNWYATFTSNPLRVKLVSDIKALGKYPYCGHGTILGNVSYGWQDRDSVLAQFGGRGKQAREVYRRFVEEGIALGRRTELVGGMSDMLGWRMGRSPIAATVPRIAAL